eukprot:CAMPEP_0202878372 /NCGR_PEP_ID=MMETSP1391-20130828/32093_1 /ASSEMBLY_ACC=CAM_ASM_000867 /TAXON_ID=1034604 /ORGANISM="Chlamydomonas leiostraca, Strain SAG 11-49" /LENGTH=30 /DNA_ID= /DNA_START= /DNA_END= /DNA_ORIENTATION=
MARYGGGMKGWMCMLSLARQAGAQAAEACV